MVLLGLQNCLLLLQLLYCIRFVIAIVELDAFSSVWYTFLGCGTPLSIENHVHFLSSQKVVSLKCDRCWVLSDSVLSVIHNVFLLLLLPLLFFCCCPLNIMFVYSQNLVVLFANVLSHNAFDEFSILDGGGGVSGTVCNNELGCFEFYSRNKTRRR